MKEKGHILKQEQTPTKVGESVRLVSLEEIATNNNKKYYRLEFSDGSKVNTFNRKQVDGLSVGAVVSYEMTKGNNGFWNLSTVTRLEGLPLTPAETPKLEPLNPPKAVTIDREYSMRSMNALTNATALFNALIPYLDAKPLNVEQGFNAVKGLHAMMLELHQDGRKSE